MSEAIKHVETILCEILDMQKNINQHFKEIFSKAEQLFKCVNSEEQIKILRIACHQKNRINVEKNTPEDYFPFSITIPVYDDFINKLKKRFSKYKTILSSLYLIILKQCMVVKVLELNFNLYSDFLNFDSLSSD